MIEGRGRSPIRKKNAKASEDPWHGAFGARNCGGEGDRAFTSTASSLNSRGKVNAKPDELQPKGQLQASLRLITSAELAMHTKYYKAFASAGVVADTTTLRASGDFAREQRPGTSSLLEDGSMIQSEARY